MSRRAVAYNTFWTVFTVSHTVVFADSWFFQTVAFSLFSDIAHDDRDVFFVLFLHGYLTPSRHP